MDGVSLCLYSTYEGNIFKCGIEEGWMDLEPTAVIAAESPSIPWFPLWEHGGVVVKQDDDPYLDTEGVAKQAGVATESVRIYLKRTRRRLRGGQALRPQDLPDADRTLGRSPVWRQSTIDAWLAARVGRGRPRSSSED